MSHQYTAHTSRSARDGKFYGFVMKRVPGHKGVRARLKEYNSRSTALRQARSVVRLLERGDQNPE